MVMDEGSEQYAAEPPSKERVTIAADYVPTHFHLTYPARAAYVLVRPDDQTFGQLAEMERSQDGTWNVALRLKPGMYRYRYYVNDGSVTVLVPGWEGKIAGGASGWDAVVRVPEKVISDYAHSRAKNLPMYETHAPIVVNHAAGKSVCQLPAELVSSGG